MTKARCAGRFRWESCASAAYPGSEMLDIMLRWLLALAMLVAGCSATKDPPQPVPVEPPSEPVAPRRTDIALGFLAHLDASHSTVLVVADPMPHLRRALESKALQKLLLDPAMARMGGDHDGLRERLEQAQPWIPEGFAVGLDGASMSMFVRFLAAVSQLTLVQASQAAGPASVRDDLPRIQSDIATSLEAMVVPSMVVWGRMHGAEEAQRAFDSMASTLGALGLPPDAITRTDDAMTVALSPVDLIDRASLLATLAALGVTTGVDDPMAPRMADAIFGLRGTLSLQRNDTELVLTLRPTDGSPPRGPLPKEQLGSMFDANATDTLLWARWDVEPASGVAAEAVAMLDRWEGTEVGRRLRELDVEDVAGDIRELDRELRSMSLRGQARVTAGDRLEARVLAEAPPPALALGGSPLLGSIPTEAWLVDLDGTESLAERLAAGLTRFEARLAKVWLKETVRGDEAAARAADEAASTYYRHMAGMRDLVLRQGSREFEPPQAMVMRTSEPMAGVELAIPATSFLVRIPVPELAFIGKPRDMRQAQAWLEAVATQAVTGVLQIAKLEPPARLRVASDVDLGLGVPTRALHLDGLVQSFPGLEIRTEPGVGLHFFAHGDFLVISTSSSLSREILRSDDEALVLRDPALLGYGRLSGAGFGDFLIAFIDGIRPTSSELEPAGAALAALARTVDEATWSTSDGAAGRLTEIVVTFVE